MIENPKIDGNYYKYNIYSGCESIFYIDSTLDFYPLIFLILNVNLISPMIIVSDIDFRMHMLLFFWFLQKVNGIEPQKTYF